MKNPIGNPSKNNEQMYRKSDAQMIEKSLTKRSKMEPKTIKNPVKLHAKTDAEKKQKINGKTVKSGGAETSKIVLPPRRRASFAKSTGPGKWLQKHQKLMPKDP